MEPSAADLVDERDPEDAEEDEHLPQSVPAELAQHDRPGVDEHGLDVEDEEQHRDHVELDAEAGAGHVGERFVAGLVRPELRRVRPAGADEVGHADRACRERHGDHTEEQDGEELVHRESVPTGAARHRQRW